MNVFLDANILVAVLNKEYPLFTKAAAILSLAGQASFRLYTSPVCLAIAFYFAEKKHGTKVAKAKMAILIEHMEIAECGKTETQLAAADPRVLDFEDGLEYYAARHAACKAIVTENVEDFYFSEIAVLDAADFLRKCVLPIKSQSPSKPKKA